MEKRKSNTEPSAGPEVQPKVDVGILTIIPEEFKAVLAAFPNDLGPYRGRREYSIRCIQIGQDLEYTVAIVRQLEQGNGEAQEAARDLIDDFDPSLLLVVGIAGGLPSEDITLGDVVLSTRINDYSVEARKFGSTPTYSLSGGPIAKRIAAGIANLEARTSDLGEWTANLPKRPKVQWKKEGKLYGPSDWQDELGDVLEEHFGTDAEPRHPIFYAGQIASSDRLIKDPEVLFPWITTARHLLAVEMESGGAYRAARDRCPMLAIRGISDLVGLTRQNSWKKYACESAAAFARAYLNTQPVPPKGSVLTPAPEEEGQEAETEREFEEIFANLVPLRSYPKTIFVAPATCTKRKQGLAILLDGHGGNFPSQWTIHSKNLVSFVNPEQTRLELICDAAATEEHDSEEWASADDPSSRKVFVSLLNLALSEDLRSQRVFFDRDDRVYHFGSNSSGAERRYKYQNVRNRSTVTVVKNYSTTSSEGQEYPFMRHHAFDGQFRFIDNEWYLEVVPTYRFTTDGRKKYLFHDKQLSGIKRIERNRSVLSQLLLWNDVVRGRPRQRLLDFGKVPVFQVETPQLEYDVDDDYSDLPDVEVHD